MNWSFVAAIVFGIYGGMLHPVIGFISFAIPALISYYRKKEREVQDKVHSELQARSKEEKHWRQQQELISLENRLRKLPNEKMNEISRIFRITARTTPMGLRDYRRFDREIIRYLEASLTESDREVCQRNGTSLRVVYDQCISAELHADMEDKQLGQSGTQFSFNGGSPREFEQHSAQLFRSCGWHVIETPVSGDHGVDLIASRSRDRIAVQCKLYSKPIGNSAVQEVVAGRVHYGANAAVVIAENGYTNGAEALAHSNSVRLIHPEDIKSLYSFLGETSGKLKYGRHLDWPPK